MEYYDISDNAMNDGQENVVTSMSEKDIKRSAKMWFNRTGGACCIHFVFTTIISTIILMLFTFKEVKPGMNTETLMESVQSGKNLLWTAAITYVLSNIPAAIICLAFIKKLRHSAKMMFSKPEFSSKFILLAIPATMFLQTISMFLQSLFVSVSGSSGMESMEMPDFIKGDLSNNILLVVYVVFLGPVTEEILFRGAVMKGLNFASRKFAVILSAALFAFFHGNIIQGIIAFLIGIFFGYLDMKAGSIIPSVVLHITNNGIATIMSYIQYKTGEELSDTVMIIYIVCSLIIGLLCSILLIRGLKSQQKSQRAFFAPRIDADKDLMKKCGIRAAVQCPFLWIYIILNTFLIILNII